MATRPLAFSDFMRRCFRPCSERDPSDKAHCPICTEEYDRGIHQAIRIVVQPPAQCNHEFCRHCLEKIFSRRKTQGTANLCPLCRTRWFQAEYQDVSARNQSLENQANNAPLTQDSASRQPATSNEEHLRRPVTVPPSQREARPYIRNSRPFAPVARPHAPSRSHHGQKPTTQFSGGFPFSGGVPFSGGFPFFGTFPFSEGSPFANGFPFSGTSPFGQQAAPVTSAPNTSQQPNGRPTNRRPAPGTSDQPPSKRGIMGGSGSSKKVPSPRPREAELQRRTSALDARERDLAQRELRVERDRQELQRRQREFNAMTEHARAYRRNPDANV
ncbi:hypothetical protein GT037_006083 [Alternaria burnsii]|uniref:RING-type domain-containing protein n=1 Tax=Alternaria burnsii TaxID=1187904 RepID=A0A8H7B3C3_9PLEO|nr:uncharacterized protein GT037_006083 [Alternaria burnsii]KAF7676578.1 hypothetical protein GT037_006083 [Alternaria burnsii]